MKVVKTRIYQALELRVGVGQYKIFPFIILLLALGLTSNLEAPSEFSKRILIDHLIQIQKTYSIENSNVTKDWSKLVINDLNISDKTLPFSKRTDFFQINNLGKEKFKELLLKGIPKSLRSKAKHHIDNIIHYSLVNNLDPIWVMSLVWTESHFSVRAKSRVKARGLMQVMPITGKAIAKKLHIKSKKGIKSILLNPKLNLKIGTYYMSNLLKRFKNNFVHATVAYNMGPTRTRWNLVNKREVGVKNIYLNKVRKYYYFLSRHLEKEIIQRNTYFKTTLVYSGKMAKKNLVTIAAYQAYKDLSKFLDKGPVLVSYNQK